MCKGNLSPERRCFMAFASLCACCLPRQTLGLGIAGTDISCLAQRSPRFEMSCTYFISCPVGRLSFLHLSCRHRSCEHTRGCRLGNQRLLVALQNPARDPRARSQPVILLTTTIFFASTVTLRDLPSRLIPGSTNEMVMLT